MTTTVAVLATLDTKGHEAQFLREQLQRLGSDALVVDVGVLGTPACRADVTREQVAAAAGSDLARVRAGGTRETATPLMAAGAARLLGERLARGGLHAAIGLGGLQGTALCSQVLRTLPYGFPKVMVSTVASGDVSAYVDVKDVTMMFSVADLLGVNVFTRRLLANAAGAAHGMAQVDVPISTPRGQKPLIGMSNLGVLTQGAQVALQRFAERGYEVLVFHAVGSGGRAMEQMLRQGILGAVFDYAMGEVTDELFGGLRAGGAERLTVAGQLGVPQVLVPGGAEHVGVLVPPNTVPERWRDHRHVFHSPVVLAPRLSRAELVQVAREIGRRLQPTRGNAVLMLPTDGTGRYAMPGGPLRDPDGDAAFFAELKAAVPQSITVVERHVHAEDPAFVHECVDRLLQLVEARR
ncbi:MAG: Tm-1-like ATP-binding domain-containing protein [Planctomycetes bacterium]|nr:Tm-1-like ATP-binding domain-containing protein [Planctomycetota bacterium]